MERTTEQSMLKQLPSAPIVDSWSFNSYLCGFLRRRELGFAPTISIPQFSPFLKDLSQQVRMGDVFNEEEKGLIYSNLIIGKEPDEHLRRYSEELANRKAAVERSMVAYLDLGDLSIKATKPRFGEFNEVASDIYGVITQGHFPLLELHTHPKNSLPSPIDYSRMLHAVVNGIPIVKGIVVLCPNIQVMALVSPSTPKLGVGRVNELVKRFSELDVESQNRADSLEHRCDVAFGMVEKGSASLRSYFRESVIELSQDYLDGLVTEEEQRRIMLQMYDASKSLFYKHQKRCERVIKKALQGSFNYDSRADNARLLEFTRLMNIKLYMATDFENFWEFSA